MNKRNAVLTLSTEIERDYILIDGEICPIKSKNELSIIDLYQVQKRFKSIHRLFTQEDLSDKELKTLKSTIDEFIDFIFVDCPQELLGKLTEGQRMEVVTTFTNLFLSSLPEAAKQETGKAESVGGEETASEKLSQ
jgi:hypothetical protein